MTQLNVTNIPQTIFQGLRLGQEEYGQTQPKLQAPLLPIYKKHPDTQDWKALIKHLLSKKISTTESAQWKSVMPALYLVQLRDDIPRKTGQNYWKGPHRLIAGDLPLHQYIQRHFSNVDHSYWPATSGVGTAVPDSWRFDGFAEVGFTSLPSAAKTLFHMKGVFYDEQNLFIRVAGHIGIPGSGRNWHTPAPTETTHQTALLIRRKRGVSPAQFSDFIHDVIGSQLVKAGSQDVRTYTFFPPSFATHPTPAVAHNIPTNYQYHAAVLFSAENRESVDQIIGSEAVAEIISTQGDYTTAIHAYTVENSVPVIHEGKRVDTDV